MFSILFVVCLFIFLFLWLLMFTWGLQNILFLVFFSLITYVLIFAHREKIEGVGFSAFMKSWLLLSYKFLVYLAYFMLDYVLGVIMVAIRFDFPNYSNDLQIYYGKKKLKKRKQKKKGR